jgi:soluble lytic murein transglycosylase-like protein
MFEWLNNLVNQFNQWLQSLFYQPQEVSEEETRYSIYFPPEGEAPSETRYIPQYQATRQKTIDEIIEEKAYLYDIPPAIVRAIVKVESNFNPYAVSMAGAKGLMQLMESTFSWLGFHPSEIFNPEANIEAGVKYLRYLYDKYGNLKDAVAAYNLGKVVKTKTGKYINQSYVDKVYSSMWIV